VREDRDLVELLAACDLLDEIPTELYAAVARILSYLHALNSDRLDAADSK
jgi:type III secretion system FlhB-like substrate exporter